MSTSCNCFSASTIGKKYFIAISAIIWSLFVMMHMIGNMLIFAGAETYNKYSHALISNPLIKVAEIVLVGALLLHAVLALTLKARNLKSKPQRYAVAPVKAKSASSASKSMAYTGSLLLAFIIWHLASFKYGPTYTVVYNGVEMRDLYRLVIEFFQNIHHVWIYLVCLCLIGIHLSHGVSSVFQSLGIYHPRYQCAIKLFGMVYAIVVTVGFLSQPIYVFLGGQ